MACEKSNQYAVSALRERRAEIAGEITALESRLRHLRESLTYVDGALCVMNPDADPSSIPNKKPYRRVKLFGQGKLNRMVLDVLRDAGQPMTTLAVAEGVTASAGFGPDAVAGLKNRVRANLLYLAKVRGLVVKDGERETATWVIGDSTEGAAQAQD